jgi:hypothetical protein
LLLLRRILQQFSPTLGPFCQGLLQHNKVVSSISTRHHQVHRGTCAPDVPGPPGA